MKRISVALTLGLSIAATQGCMTDSVDTMDVGSADQAVCESLSYSKVMAALLVALADETGELHPTKYLTIQTNKFGTGIDGVSLSSVAAAKCQSRGKGNCDDTDMILALQNVTGIDPAVLQVPDYRSNLVSKLRDQQIWENGRTCLPPAHTLTMAGTSPAACGTHYQFTANFGAAGGFEVTREAESFNTNNRNGSQHNWTQSGGAMTIGPDWAHTWTSPATAPNLVYSIAFPAAGTYKVWVSGKGANGNNDSAYVGINNSSNGALMDFPENNQYGWVGMDISVPSAGNHNVHLYAREDGFFADKLVVNQSSTPPSGATGCPAPTPASLKDRIDRFQVNSSGYIGFSSDATSIFLDPDDIVDPVGGGSGSGSNTCGTMPASGSDKLTIAYSVDKEGDCCWQNFTQKTYKRHMTRYLVCKD